LYSICPFFSMLWFFFIAFKSFLSFLSFTLFSSTILTFLSGMKQGGVLSSHFHFTLSFQFMCHIPVTDLSQIL
jgi:hypothetical protein